MANKLKELLAGKGANYILPFFWQHGEDEATLREYMKVIDEANIGAVCVESRPHPDYVGPKWWEDMDVILDEARKRNMKVWILDDSHFPTGFANGAMKDQPLTLARKSVCAQKYQVSGPAQFTLNAMEVKHPAIGQPSPLEAMLLQLKEMSLEECDAEYPDDELLSLAAVSAGGAKIDLMASVTTEGLVWDVPAGDWTVYKTNVSRNRGPHRTYVNMMDAESVKVLLDTVYEPHWDHYKDDFGSTIEGFFSDEPELGNGHLYDAKSELGQGFGMDYPWSRELAAALAEEFGDELPFMLPLIWETEGDEDARAHARYVYMNHVSRLVEKDFSFQLGDWCRAHGVKYIGHEIEDNGQHARTGSSLGHYFRGLAGQSWAGIDDIGGQVYPQGEDDDFDRGPFQVRKGHFYHYLLGKLASSHAAIDPLKQGDSMCELFGAYGWQEGVKLEKYLTDHLLSRGINHFVPHAFSPAPFPDPDCPPHFYAHGHNPQYRHFGELMKYMNNVSHLLSDGRHVAPVAILYHGEAEWTGKLLPGEEVAMRLAEAQIEYDILPQDVFAETDRFKTVIGDGKLCVNTQTYSVLIVPYMQYIAAKTASALAELEAAGLKVIYVEKKPEGIYDACCGKKQAALLEGLKDSCLLTLDQVTAALRGTDAEDIVIGTPNRYIHHRHYIHKDGMEVYMIINEGKEVYRSTIEFKGRDLTALAEAGCLLRYDAWNNKLYPAKVADGLLQVQIVPNKSELLILADTELAAVLADQITEEVCETGTAVAMNEGWKRSICSSTAYPAFEQEAVAALPDSLEQEQPLFSGFVRYENTLEAEAGKKYVLSISDASEGVELFVNGVSQGIQIVPHYIYDITEAVKEGTNEIVIEVATTLEREMSTVPDRFGRPSTPPTCPSGISGTVTVYVQ